MFGNLRALYSEIVEFEDCPIKENIKHYSPLHLIRACSDEQWKELRNRMERSTELALHMPNLGKFQVRLSGIRKYLHLSIARLRYLRVRLQSIKESNPDADLNQFSTYNVYMALEQNVRVAWKQLDKLRQNMIIKNIQWNIKQIEAGKSEKIKFHYENIDYKFVRSYIKDKTKH